MERRTCTTPLSIVNSYNLTRFTKAGSVSKKTSEYITPAVRQEPASFTLYAGAYRRVWSSSECLGADEPGQSEPIRRYEYGLSPNSFFVYALTTSEHVFLSVRCRWPYYSPIVCCIGEAYILA